MCKQKILFLLRFISISTDVSEAQKKNKHIFEREYYFAFITISTFANGKQ